MIPDFLKLWALTPEASALWPYLAIVFALSYLLGSIPFGMVIAKVMNLGNLREIGSGNIGATNVLRTGSKKAALATVLLDSGKGVVAVLLARWLLGEEAAQIAALGAFLGHIFPIYLKFKGGKGVATYLGIMLALNFWVGLSACGVWLATAVLFRMSSLAGIMASAAAPLLLYYLHSPLAVWLGIVLALLVWLRHKDNIFRILQGTEPKIGTK